MFSWLFRSKRPAAMDNEEVDISDGAYIELKGRSIHRKVKPVVGSTILAMAETYGVDWSSNCKRGTCARCRCYVSEGTAYLSNPNNAEFDRLGEEEIEQGYRLGCQTTVVEPGKVVVKHASYF